MKNTDRKLNGMKEICTYVSRSEATVLDWILRDCFPADNVNGIWESSTNRIDAFFKAKAMEALG